MHRCKPGQTIATIVSLIIILNPWLDYEYFLINSEQSFAISYREKAKELQSCLGNTALSKWNSSIQGFYEHLRANSDCFSDA
jgi:hypothetical protein